MTAQKGEDIILKVGDGATPTEVFTQIGGMRNTKILLENNTIDNSDLSSGRWRDLQSASGLASLVISGDGYFTDSSAEEILRGYAFASTVNNYQLYFGNGDSISGAFLISKYQRDGGFSSQEEFFIELLSSGAVAFAAE